AVASSFSSARDRSFDPSSTNTTSHESPTPGPTSARNPRSRRSSSGMIASSLKIGRTNERTGPSIDALISSGPVPGPTAPPQPPTRTFKVLVVAIFALGALLRAPTFARPLLSDDEAIYAATADAMARGDLLYRDVVDHKPPAIYHIYELGFATFGRYDTQGAHALVVLAVLLTAGFLLGIARRRGAAPSDGAGLAAAGLFLIFSTTWHDYDALAANCELFLLAPQAAAAWLLLRDLDRPARGARRWAI